jgi:ACS family tartrate transporter-like MFS transporter
MNAVDIHPESDRILARAAWRLIPFMSLMYVVSFLDRVNISFASLRMNQDLGFSPEIYGFASGVFFFGYFLFEVPSNLMLQKVGARLWMCRICISWGFLSMLTAFAREPVGFCIVRFLLGAAEAGLYPGMVLYMTYWFPASTRARFIALFLAGVPLANVIGAPISTALLGVGGHGLAGWQWMIVLEGIPSILCGIATLWVLPDGPAKAKWLSEAEKRILAARLAAEPKGALHGLREMLTDRRIWILMIPDFAIVFPLYALNFFLPQMVHGMGYSIRETGVIVALPYLLAMGAMVALGWSSDRSGNRAGHVAFAGTLAALGVVGATLASNNVLVIAALCLATSGIYAALAVFWTLPASLLRGTAAAAGLALLNSFSNLGGFFGPTLMGWAKQQTGTYGLGLSFIAGMLVLGSVSVIAIGRAFFSQLDTGKTS